MEISRPRYVYAVHEWVCKFCCPHRFRVCCPDDREEKELCTAEPRSEFSCTLYCSCQHHPQWFPISSFRDTLASLVTRCQQIVFCGLSMSWHSSEHACRLKFLVIHICDNESLFNLKCWRNGFKSLQRLSAFFLSDRTADFYFMKRAFLVKTVNTDLSTGCILRVVVWMVASCI